MRMLFCVYAYSWRLYHTSVYAWSSRSGLVCFPVLCGAVLDVLSVWCRA
jgi:hypothetical protein